MKMTCFGVSEAGIGETVAVARPGDVPRHRTRARKPWASKAGRVGRRDGPGRWGDSSERRLEPELDVVCWPLVQRAALWARAVARAAPCGRLPGTRTGARGGGVNSAARDAALTALTR